MRRLAILTLTCGALLVAGAAQAQGRGSDARQLRKKAQQLAEQKAADPDLRAARLEEMASWLGRLPARYTFAGEARAVNYLSRDCIEGGFCYLRRQASGTAECTAIAAGPGVHCAISAVWPRFFRPELFLNAPEEIIWRGPYLDIAMMLFGIDPDVPAIRLLLVDGQSRAIEALGVVQDKSVAFRLQCAPDPDAANCPVLRIRQFADDGKAEMEYLGYWSSGSSVPPRYAFHFSMRSEPATPLLRE